MRRSRAAAPRGVTWQELCELGLKLSGVVQGTSYGTPALHVRKALLVRLKEDGQTAVVRVDPMDREILLQADPDAFFLTEHYVGYPWILVRLARVPKRVLVELLEQAWRRVAPKRLVAEGGSPMLGNGRPGASSAGSSDQPRAERRRRTKR
jgi:hypothetical protein